MNYLKWDVHYELFLRTVGRNLLMFYSKFARSSRNMVEVETFMSLNLDSIPDGVQIYFGLSEVHWSR